MENTTIEVSGKVKLANGTVAEAATSFPAVKPDSLAEAMKLYPKLATDEKTLVNGWYQRTVVIFSQNAARNGLTDALEAGKSVEEAKKAGQEAGIDYLKNGPQPGGGIGRGPSIENVFAQVLADAKSTSATAKASVAAAKAFQGAFFTDPAKAATDLRAHYNALKAATEAKTAAPAAK